MPTTRSVPEERILVRKDLPPRADGEFVLYWMIAARRGRSNFGLQRAVELARDLDRPLVVLEGLRAGYRWVNDRLHRFALEGTRDNAAWFAARGVLYYPYVEPRHDDGKGLIAALSERACAVVTDEYPCFMLPRMVAAAAEQSRARLESVDSNGLLPLAAAGVAFPTAYAFRRFLQRNLRPHLDAFPREDPLARVELRPLRELPSSIRLRWPSASDELLAAGSGALAHLPIDHGVAPAALQGGSRAAERELQRFLGERLVDYAEKRSDATADASSGLSPWLHWGHLSAHDVFRAIARREDFSAERLAESAHGKKEGWWGLPAHVESFLDELITWRELGFHFCARVPDYDRFASLPAWARATLDAHRGDRREHVYALRDFEAGATHDELWNAAQGQLLSEGRIHNYLRMLWGKKVLEWTRRPEDALEVLIELNNKYALDGRDPNSYSGIFWCLGRFDRPWAPQRPVFGAVRYMSSGNTARKMRVEEYIERYRLRRPRAVQRRLN